MAEVNHAIHVKGLTFAFSKPKKSVIGQFEAASTFLSWVHGSKINPKAVHLVCVTDTVVWSSLNAILYAIYFKTNLPH